MAHVHDMNIDLNGTVDLSLLSEEEKWRYIHQQMHLKHRGHESMHAWMVVILFLGIGLGQFILLEWRKRNLPSFQRWSLCGMWLLPLYFGLRHSWYTFLFTWTVFSAVTFFMMMKALKKPISANTPRLVYKWFYIVYMTSYAVSIFFYIVTIMIIIGLNIVIQAKIENLISTCLIFFCYGVYYGVLCRDIAEIATDKMAITMGYYTLSGVPTRQLENGVCAVCGNKIIDLIENNELGVEKCYKLNCGHTFHESCIRGWCIIGKKQTCPYCREKVELKKFFTNPWEQPQVLYGFMLDLVRYMVAWQPLILTLVQIINYLLGLE